MNVIVLITLTKVVFGETLLLSPGEVQFVYFSAGGADVLGYSQPLTVR